MTERHDPALPADLLPWLTGHVLDAGTPRWDRFTELAVATVAAADGAAVALLADPEPAALGGSDVAAIEADRYQARVGEGPALLAVRTRALVHAPDLAADRRWPRYGRHAIALGLRAAMCVTDCGGDGPVALTLYSRRPRAFGPADEAAAVLLAEALGAARAMSAAVRNGAIVEQAKGIVMSENRCSPEEAFAELRACAMRRGIHLHTLAAQIVAGTLRPWDDAFPRHATSRPTR